MKRCSRCGTAKPLTEFYINKRKRDGLCYECKECSRDSHKRWNQANPEKIHAARKAWKRANPASRILSDLRTRCKKRGIPLNLTADTLPPIPECCPVLGIPLSPNAGPGPSPNSPSLDRLVPELGYVVGNVAWISMRANQIKSDASLEELERVTEWTRQQLGTTHPVS